MLHFIYLHVRQNAERDSSDEEWDDAYAAMDPIAQYGWGTPGNALGDGTARLVRDVFVAGDMVHEAALVEIGVARHDMGEDINDEADSRESTLEADGDASAPHIQNPHGREEGHMEGIDARGCVLGLPLRAWQRQCTLIYMYIYI